MGTKILEFQSKLVPPVDPKDSQQLCQLKDPLDMPTMQLDHAAKEQNHIW